MRGAVEQHYERFGPRRHVVTYYSAFVAGEVVLCALAVVAFLRYRDLSFVELIEIALVAEVSILVLAAIAVVSGRRVLSPGVRIVERGGSHAEALQAWRTISTFPIRSALPLYLSAILVAVLPVAAFCHERLDLTWGETLGLAMTMIVAGTWPTVVLTFSFEIWNRPLVRDLAAYLRVEDVRETPTLPLARRLVVGIPVICCTSAFFTIVLRAPADLERIGTDVVVAILIGLGTAVPLVVVTTMAVTGPLGELLAGTRRVREGDYTTKVPPVLADELGLLASGFNAMTEDLQRAREQEVVAREEERRRLARDLHDGLGPTLAALGLRLQRVAKRVDDPDLRDEVRELGEDMRGAVGDVRRLVYGLRPPALDDIGLVAAIERSAVALGAGEGAPRVTVVAEDALPKLPAAVEVAALRIAEEAMTNVVRHAHARKCDVRIRCDGKLELEVVDDGTGFRRGQVGRGLGLTTMRERALELGGRLELASHPASGTTVRAQLPVEVVAG